MTRKYFSQTNLDFRILDIQNTCKKITIHFDFVYYDWLRLCNQYLGGCSTLAGSTSLGWPQVTRPYMGRRAGSV